jgi:hypothetical protein
MGEGGDGGDGVTRCLSTPTLPSPIKGEGS